MAFELKKTHYYMEGCAESRMEMFRRLKAIIKRKPETQRAPPRRRSARRTQIDKKDTARRGR